LSLYRCLISHNCCFLDVCSTYLITFIMATFYLLIFHLIFSLVQSVVVPHSSFAEMCAFGGLSLGSSLPESTDTANCCIVIPPVTPTKKHLPYTRTCVSSRNPTVESSKAKSTSMVVCPKTGVIFHKKAPSIKLKGQCQYGATGKAKRLGNLPLFRRKRLAPIGENQELQGVEEKRRTYFDRFCNFFRSLWSNHIE
jgi:hypothetical protein